MYTSMKTFALASTVSIFALAGAATAADAPKISMIDVEASYSAAQGSNAAETFPQIASDIKLAIADRVETSDDASDPMIRVDIRKVALDGDTIIPDSAEFNELEGVVSISSENGTLGDQTFPINIVAMTDPSVAPEGYFVIAPSTDDFYNAMVFAFADNVAEKLESMNTAGDGVSK